MKKSRSKIIIMVSLMVAFLFAGSAFFTADPIFASGTAATYSSSHKLPTTLPLPEEAFLPQGKQAFSFVSDFETLTLEGWQSLHGSTPRVVTSKNYSGEPSLMSSANDGAQVDYANQSFVLGQRSLSFQVAMNATLGSFGYFGLGSKGNFVAVVGVHNGTVVAGANLTSLKNVGAIPKKTAYPSGWVYIIADLNNTKNGKWYMQVFVDETQQVSKQVLVPNAGKYDGAMIETDIGTVYYTNIIVSTFQMANLVPGYHPMQGYGGRVASAGIVRLLPAFYNLTAVMTLNSFSVPQSDVLSFQINAQNKTAATQSTCVGFFQIGLFLDSQKGYIDPWYVPNGDCIPYSFSQGSTLHIPKGEKVVLSIVYKQNSKEIVFKEYYPSIHKTLSATIFYRGSDFYSAYTQMEFQPTYGIQNYKLSGSIFGIQITPISHQSEYLPASYMMPFNLDAPTTWDVHYYVNATAGYDELTT